MNSRVKDDLVQSLKSFLPFEVVNPNPSNRYDKLLTYIKESDVPDNVNLFYPDKLALVGNLGIGTRNPVRGLHLEGDSGTSAIRFKTTGGEWDFAPFWSAFDDGNFSLNRVSGSGNLLIPSGNVGIGTDSPTSVVDIEGSPSALTLPLQTIEKTGDYIGKDDIQELIRLVGKSNTENSGVVPSAGTALTFYNRWTGGSAYSVGRIAGRGYQGYNGGLQFDVSDNTGSGQSNFTTAMTIIPSGFVGIGTTDPATRLQIDDNGDGHIARFRGTGTNAGQRAIDIGVGNTDVSALETQQTYIYTTATNSANSGLVLAAEGGTSAQSGVLFYTGLVGSLTQRMRIDRDGNVGIGSAGATADFTVWTDGTSSTAAGFTVDASADEVIVGQLSGGGNTTFKVRNRLNDTVFSVTPDAPSTTVFAPNIATGSAATLTVKIGSINSDSIRLEAGGTTSTWLESRGYLGHSWYVDTTRSMTLNSTGLGIGTDDPSVRLDVRKDETVDFAPNNDQRIRAQLVVRNNNEGAEDFSSISFVTGGSNQAEWSINNVYKSAYNGDLAFKTRAGGGNADWRERMRINNAGNLGIGEDAPPSLLTLKGGNILLEYNSTGADDGHGIFFHTTTNGWSEAASHAAIYGKRVDASNGYLRFDTRSGGTTAERMRLGSDGVVYVYGEARTGVTVPSNHQGAVLQLRGNTQWEAGYTPTAQNSDHDGVIEFFTSDGSGVGAAANVGKVAGSIRSTALDPYGRYGIEIYTTDASGDTTTPVVNSLVGRFYKYGGNYATGTGSGDGAAQFSLFGASDDTGITDSPGSAIYLNNLDSTVNNYTLLNFRSMVSDGTNYPTAQIRGIKVSDNTAGSSWVSGALAFDTVSDGTGHDNPGNAGSFKERMRIHSDGAVSIGNNNLNATYGILNLSNTNGVGNSALYIEDAGGIGYSLGIVDGSQAFSISEGANLNSQKRFEIDTNGGTIIGGADIRSLYAAGDYHALLYMEGTPRNDGGKWREWPGISIIANNANTGGAAIDLGHARGTALGNNTAIVDNDNLGALSFAGADGTAIQRGAVIYAQANGDWSGTNRGTDIVFQTTANGSTAYPSERVRINSSGLDVTGDINFTGNLTKDGADVFEDSIETSFFMIGV